MFTFVRKGNYRSDIELYRNKRNERSTEVNIKRENPLEDPI